MRRFNCKHKPKHTTKVKFKEVYDRCPKLPVLYYIKTQSYTYKELQPIYDSDIREIFYVKHFTYKFGNCKYKEMEEIWN